MSRLPNRPAARTPIENLPPAPMPDWTTRRGNWSPQQPFRSSAVPLWIWLTIGGGILGLGVLITLAIVIAIAVANRAEDRQALRELQESAEDFRQQQMDGSVSAGALGAQYDGYVTNFEQKGATMGGAEGHVVRAASAVMRTMQPEVMAYAQAMQRLEESGGLDPSIMKSKSDIDRLSATVRDMKAASTRLSQRVETLPDMFAQELRSQSVKENDIRQALAGFRAASNLDLALQTHEQDRKGCDIMLKMLDLLKREWSRWSVDSSSGEVAFQNAGVMRQYNTLITDLTACAVKQEQLQQQLLEAQRRAGALGGMR